MKIVEKCAKSGTTKKVNFDGMCKECYDKSINAVTENNITNEDTQKQNSINKIFALVKEKFTKETIKTIAIVFLIFLLFCCIFSDDTKRNVELSQQVENLTNQISQLNAEIENNNSKLKDNEKEITTLKGQKSILEQEKSKLESEKGNLEKEKSELTTKVQELEKTSTKKNITQTTVASANSQAKKSSSSNTSSNTKSSEATSKASKSSTTQTTNTSMVWVGKTGTKYHNQTCPTLKGKGSQITMQQALSEGRTACKVCH